MSSEWKTKELSDTFLENVRGAIPLAETQFEVMHKMISLWFPEVGLAMDLGCGDAVVGRALLSKFPSAELVCVDFSESMLDSAREHFSKTDAVHFVEADYSSSDWTGTLNDFGGFDVIVSGFSIHHQTDEKKQEVYSEIYGLLNPGGVFLNLEHVSSSTKEVEAAFDDYFIDSLYEFNRKANPEIERQTVVEKYYNRTDKQENILAPLEEQCDWLRRIGFQDVDCFFKIFELTLFGGRKPGRKDL